MNTVPESIKSEAMHATRAFVEALEAERLQGWAQRFAEILSMLERDRLREAIHLYEQTKYTGPGSLSDVYANDEEAFNAAWGHCSAALRALQAQGSEQ